MHSVFALKSISGRQILGVARTGLFPTDASDFEFAKLTLSESDDAKMIWWLFMPSLWPTFTDMRCCPLARAVKWCLPHCF